MRIGKYRIVNGIRFSFSIILLTVLIITGFSLITNSFTVDAIDKTEYVEVQVSPGDTVWTIAKTHRSEKQDIRELVYMINKVNNIENNIIYSGQVLKVPINYN